MPANNEQIYMEQSQTVENEYTVGDKVYYKGTGETFENGDRLEHGKQGKVVGPATSERCGGTGVAVLFSGNKGVVYSYLTQARCRRSAHPQLPASLTDPLPSNHNTFGGAQVSREPPPPVPVDHPPNHTMANAQVRTDAC